MARRPVEIVIAVLLLLEGLQTGLWLAGLVPGLAGRDAVTLTLVAIRGLVGAAELMSGFLLLDRRAAGPVLARRTLLASALLITLEVGWRLAPSNLDPTFKWWVVGGYWIYALAASAWLR